MAKKRRDNFSPITKKKKKSKEETMNISLKMVHGTETEKRNEIATFCNYNLKSYITHTHTHTHTQVVTVNVMSYLHSRTHCISIYICMYVCIKPMVDLERELETKSIDETFLQK